MVILIALLALCSSALSGCGHVREYNKVTPEIVLQRSVEAVPSGRAVRLELTTGETIEGFLVRRDWPTLTLATVDSLRVVDGRGVMAAWEQEVDKRKGARNGAMIGAAILAIPVAVLAYSLNQHPPCSRYESYSPACTEGKEGSELALATVGGALGGAVIGGVIGFIVGTSVSPGELTWERIYP
jgi:hypothetical protein